MRVYVGQTRSRSLLAELGALGFGEMTNQGEAPPRRFPFALDNGAFKAWKAGAPFCESSFLRDLDLVSSLSPDFVVVPDLVAGGLDSLALSAAWLPRLRGAAPLYLCVQDGMSSGDLAPFWGEIAGVFVGGSLPWKIASGAAWVALAHSKGKRCHIGRVGVPWRVEWAQRIGADSIDSCFPLWSKENLWKFCAALSRRQGRLF